MLPCNCNLTPPPFTRDRYDFKSFSTLLNHKNTHLNLPQIKQIHTKLYHESLHHHPVILTQLLTAAASVGAIAYASSLFATIRHPDLVLFNSMLKALTLNSLFANSLLFFLEFLDFGLLPDQFTFVYLFKAAGALTDTAAGRQFHSLLVKSPTAGSCVFVLNALVDMYFKCGKRDLAMCAFQRIAKPDLASWNVVMSGLVKLGEVRVAKEVFDGMPERNVVSWNVMISAFARAGEMESAKRVFDEMPEKNSVSWNTLIAGLCQNGQSDEALAVFSQMLESVEPDKVTILTVASAVGECQSIDHRVVDRIEKFARLKNSMSVSTAMLNLYAKNGRTDDARRVFDEIAEKDVIAWNAMIGGYSQNRKPVEAIELFRLMQEECGTNVRADGVTMVSLISSCAQMGALGLGEWVHAYIEKNEIELDVFLMTALVDMYAKCGDLDQAHTLFLEMSSKDLASWNAMVKGLAIHGKGKEALEVFDSMERSGLVPNYITFVGLLSACSHGGLVEEGLKLFHVMQSRYNITPRIEHYGCVVDLLGRAGRLDEASQLVNCMPLEPDAIIWGALLGACRSHQNVGLAEEAARRLVELEPSHDGNYVLLSNVYASVGNWEEVEKVRSLMKKRCVHKSPGCSVVELGGVVHEFRAGEKSHPQYMQIYRTWDALVERLKPMGYEPNTGALLRNLDKEDKEKALSRHSEKLALSFALISTASGSPIRIVKNLRICSDCHRAMELVSKLEEREVIIRDQNRFHHFSGGQCSCGGYW